MILREMAEGRTPVGSMGTDTPLAALSNQPRRLAHYFHQLFAQVTNPPMDPIREKLVMSLRTFLGANGSLLEETEQQANKIEIASPILSFEELAEIEAHRDALAADAGDAKDNFPPGVDSPLFGTYANIVYVLEARRQLIQWCLWVAEQFDAAKAPRRSA